MPPHSGPRPSTRSLTWRWDVNILDWVVWDGSLSVGSVTIGTVLQGSPPWTIDLIRVGGATLTEGQKAMAASIPVVVASDQSAISVTGPLTDTQLRASAVPISGTVTANAGTNLNTSALALEAGGNLAAIKADVDKIPSQGQALAAASMPVVLTAAQITTLTPPAAITGFALETTQSAQSTLLGAVTETAPASDTASSGLNGRLQRIAQRITSLIALFPAALGAGGGLKVDGSGTALPVSGTLTAVTTITNPVSTKTDLTPSSPTAASVGVSSAQALASNANRKGLILVNTHATQRISLGFGATAVLDSGVTLYPQGSFNMAECDFDLGAVNAIASGATTNLAIQEYT